MNFWEWLVNAGLIQGDPAYYSGGKAAPEEYTNAIRTAITNLDTASDDTARTEFFRRLQETGAYEGDPNYYASGAAGAGEVENLINVASGRLASTPGIATAPTAAPQVPSAPHPLEPGAPAAPVVGTPTGILAGGYTVRTRQPDGTYRWFQVYQLPPGSGQHVAYQFNDVQQVEAALGPMPGFADWSPNQFTQNTQGGSVGAAEEVIGMGGDWNTFSQEIMQQAAARAGVSDPTLIGRMWSDPQMQQIAGKAIIGNWTPEQILAEQRKTTFWTDTLYPGITRFYGKTGNPEKAWLDYSQNVEGGLIALGYQKDADGTFNTSIKKMLDKGLDDQIFLSQVPIFQQAQQNAKYLDVLNQWTQRDLGRTVDFNDFFGFLAGESMPELQEVAERAQVAYQAQQANAGITDAQVERLAAETDMSQAEAAALFGEFNRSLIALGEPGLKRGGLTRDEILSAAAGIEPQSGRSIEEVRLLSAKLAQENDLFDEEKINFYVGFTPAGTPTRPGLAPLAPQSA